MALGVMSEKTKGCQANCHTGRGHQHEQLPATNVAQQGGHISAQNLDSSNDYGAGIRIHGAARLGEYIGHVIDHGKETTELIGNK